MWQRLLLEDADQECDFSREEKTGNGFLSPRGLSPRSDRPCIFEDEAARKTNSLHLGLEYRYEIVRDYNIFRVSIVIYSN